MPRRPYRQALDRHLRSVLRCRNRQGAIRQHARAAAGVVALGRIKAADPSQAVPRAISPNAKPDRQRAVVLPALRALPVEFNMKSLTAAVPVCPVLCVKSSL
jgi:hypothetical protein